MPSHCCQTKNYKLVMLVLLVVGLWFFVSVYQSCQVVSPREELLSTGIDYTAADCLADECLLVEDLSYPVGQLTVEAEEALLMALDDEYKAWAMYDQTISLLGQAGPFVMIRRAEEQHISSLKALFDKYGVEIPTNLWLGKSLVSNGYADMCHQGVEAEIANVALYQERLLPVIEDYPDLMTVFTNLMTASRDRHLPAFEKCAGVNS
ncbi:hypothetical protein MUP65_02280 [Patescibacteria group bacterium]|nr:hypothetical protein [Patescibacteria group bacterium]